MTETLDPVTDEMDPQRLAEQLLAQAKEQGVELVGPNGLLNRLTKNVLETVLEAEMAEHLGYDKHDPAGRGSGNFRNGTRTKTGADRDRPGGDRGAPRHRLLVRSADRAQAATPVDRGG